jgi:hypothetical protein
LRQGPTASALALVALALVAAGCGDSDEPDPSSRPPERIDTLPKLPSGWRPHVNPDAGFALGVPRGWTASDRGGTTLLRSFDRLAAVSISADRTDPVAIPIEDYAERALVALAGFEDQLDPSDPKPYEHRYEAVSVRASGTAETGVDQAVEVIVLRRDALANFTVVSTANSEQDSDPARRVAERVIDTIRGRPVAAPAA